MLTNYSLRLYEKWPLGLLNMIIVALHINGFILIGKCCNTLILCSKIMKEEKEE